MEKKQGGGGGGHHTTHTHTHTHTHAHTHTRTQGTLATSFSTDWGPFSTESATIAIFCLVTENKGQTFRGIIYSTSGHTAFIFSPILSP